MPTSLQNSSVAVVKLPTGTDVYDGIMSDIEPDLVSSMIPLLDMKYAGETSQQNRMRLAKYRAAYEEYGRRFAQWATEMNQLVTKYRKGALKLEEQESRAKEDSALLSIEDQFNTTTSSTPSL